MENSRRIDRVGRSLQRSVAQYLISGFKHPLRGLVSVSHVEVTKDLRYAHVFVSVLGSEEDRQFSLSTLKSHAGDVQRHVAKEVPLRFCPRIDFREDRGAENFLQVQETLKNLRGEDS